MPVEEKPLTDPAAIKVAKQIDALAHQVAITAAASIGFLPRDFRRIVMREAGRRLIEASDG